MSYFPFPLLSNQSIATKKNNASLHRLQLRHQLKKNWDFLLLLLWLWLWLWQWSAGEEKYLDQYLMTLLEDLLRDARSSRQLLNLHPHNRSLLLIATLLAFNWVHRERH